MNFKNVQQKISEDLINSNSSIFRGDKAGAKFRGISRDFVLMNGLNNLFEPIEKDVINYFKWNKISWWGGYRPTGHVLSSQIACLNHLFLIRNDKATVLTLLQNIDKNFVDVLEIVTDKYNPAFIQSESTSEYDHLNEGIPIDQSKYQKITPERLLSGIPESKYSELLGYLTERYWKFFVPTTPEEGIRKISKVLIPSKKN